LFIKGIHLRNFRNYKTLDIGFSESFNILYGENAQGKTNILEAIYLCASGRSHRTSRDNELIKFGENYYYVKIDLVKEDIEYEIEIQYEVNSKKRIKINEIPQKKIGALMGKLNAVMFSPEDLLIIKEGPAERRRFIDIAISQIKPAYFYDLQQYSKILAQRNTLLKNLQENRALYDTLEVWNENLVKTGSRIIKTRKEFIKTLSNIAEEKHGKLTDFKEKLNLNYVSSVKIDGIDSLEDIERVFRNTLKNSLMKEIYKGTTLSGPQRDDIEILLNDNNAKHYGSQGQQRTAVLSLKLFEVEIMRRDSNEYPVLLLDDVMSELDSSRQEYLFENLDDIQGFITGTEYDLFVGRKMKGNKLFHVQNGQVELLKRE